MPTMPFNFDRPSSKPPSEIREKLMKKLPRYSGVYSVGLMEIECPVEEPRTFSTITRNHRHVLELETVLFNIYYPSAFGSGAGIDPAGRKNWSRATWMPRPRRKMANGYARFAGVPPAIIEPFLLGSVGLTKTRAFRNARLAQHWPPPQNAHVAGHDVKNEAGSVPKGESGKPKFPLLIFSHGLGGNRTTYSSVCGEFASYGFIVVALEHRDGSGVRTFVNHPSDEWRRRNNADHLNEEYKKEYDKVDYIWPVNNPVDTMPNNEKGVDLELRGSQTSMRKAEIKEVEIIMQLICDGKGHLVAGKNLRQGQKIGSSSRGLEGVDWSEWEGRFHLDQVTMLGHSFGAATTVSVLRDREMFPNMGQGIIYDIWGGPVMFDEQQKISSPLLGINSEAFMYWEANLRAATRVVKEAEAQGALAWLLTVRGTVHISQSDFHLLFPRLTRLLLGATVDPRRAMAININASLEFLKLVMPERISQMNRGSNERVLGISTLKKMPTEHRPKDKWIAMRLGSRTPRDLTRGLSKRKQRRSDSICEIGIEREVWMHVAPTRNELERKGLHNRPAPEDGYEKPNEGDAADEEEGEEFEEVWQDGQQEDTKQDSQGLS